MGQIVYTYLFIFIYIHLIHIVRTWGNLRPAKFHVLENKDRSTEEVQNLFVLGRKLCTTFNFAVTGKVSIPIQFQSYCTKFLLHSEKTQIHLVARKRRTKHT
jgi:hypothetical protein